MVGMTAVQADLPAITQGITVRDEPVPELLNPHISIGRRCGCSTSADDEY